MSLTASLRCNVIVKRYNDDLYEVLLLLKMSNKKEKLDLLKQKILKRVFLSGDSEYQYAQVEPLFRFLPKTFPKIPFSRAEVCDYVFKVPLIEDDFLGF